MADGLARLIELDEAELLEESARFDMATANMYSTEHEWANKLYSNAKNKLRRAKEIREGHENRAVDSRGYGIL